MKQMKTSTGIWIICICVLWLALLVIENLPQNLLGDFYKGGANSAQNSGQNIVQKLATTTITIIMAGDIMFDRQERAFGQKDGYDSLLAKVAPLFHSADIAVANLEGPITSNRSLTLTANGKTTGSLAFTFATTTATVLANAGVTLVSLANNHEDNFGRAGVEETHKWLDQAGVEWFGDPANDNFGSTSTEKIICKNKICIAFVGYHEFEPGFENILADVSRLSAAGYPVIVMPHWGDEYASTSPARVKKKARELVDAGAFAIIGPHPHVIEDREWIGDVPVIYSLGNLLFDQYFSPAVKTGNIAELTISKGEGPAQIDRVRLYTVNRSSPKDVKPLETAPIIVGEPIEFTR